MADALTFRRNDDGTFAVGVGDDVVVFQASRTTMASHSGVYRIVVANGPRIDVTDLDPADAPAEGRRQRVQERLRARVRELSVVCPPLGKAISGIRCETEDGRVVCWLPRYVGGARIDTTSAKKTDAMPTQVAGKATNLETSPP